MMMMPGLVGDWRGRGRSMLPADVVRRHQVQVEHQEHRDRAERPFHNRNCSTVDKSSHISAGLGAPSTGLSACLALRHVMSAAFFGAPVADLGTQPAELLYKRTVPGDGVGAKPADRRAFHATGWTGVGACLAAHVGEAVPTLGRAVVTSG